MWSNTPTSNPFLDRFRDRFSTRRRRRPERVLEEWKLWDHIDAILALAVTQLVDRILNPKEASSPSAVDTKLLPLKSLDRAQARDLLLLAACYDQSTAEAGEDRWRRLRRKLRFPTWQRKWDVVLPFIVAAVAGGLIVYFHNWHWLRTVWPYLAVAAGCVPWVWRFLKSAWQARCITRNTRSLIRNPKRAAAYFAAVFRPANFRPTAAQLPTVRRPLRTVGQAAGRFERVGASPAWSYWSTASTSRI